MVKKLLVVLGSLVLVAVALFFSYGFGFMIGNKAGTRDATAYERFFHEIDNQDYYACCVNYQISGDKLIEKIGKYERVLFDNLKGVKEARLGPEGKTLHFLLNGSQKVNNVVKESLCVDLKSGLRPITVEDQKFAEGIKKTLPRQTSPWDFSNYFDFSFTNDIIPHVCDSGYKNVLGKSSFIYLELGNSQSTGKIVVEQAGSNRVIPVQRNQLLGLGTRYLADKGNYYQTSHFWSDKVIDIFYPSDVFTLLDSKLVLRFGNKLFVVDKTDNSLYAAIDLIDLNSELANEGCGVFVRHGDSNILVIEKGYCEVGKLIGLIDLSGYKPKIQDISKFGFNNNMSQSYEIEEFKDNVLTIKEIYNKDISFELGFKEKECQGNLSGEDTVDLDNKYQQLAEAKYPGKEIKCGLCEMGSSCSMVDRVERYQYSTETGLNKVD